VSNPVAIIDKFIATNDNYHFTSSIGLEVALKKNVMLNTDFALSYNSLQEQIFMPNHGMAHYYNNEAFNVSKGSNNYLLSIYNNTYLTFKKTINKVHHISSSTGLNMMSNKYQFDWGVARNAHENDQYQNLQDGASNLRRIGGENKNWNWLSLYENLNYTFKDRYLATASISLDGSSRIGVNAINTIKIINKTYGLFYSGGIGWRLSSEPFLNKISWLDELKLRASFGKTGNDDIGETNGLDYSKAVRFRESVGLYPALIPNKSLSYETVSQTNIGIDIVLWASRVRVTIDLFNSTINDMLILTPLKSYFGYSYKPENGGKMQNTGIEMDAFIRIVEGRSFKWDFQANFSKVKNEILALKGDNLISQIEGGEIVNQVGSAANSFYGYIFDGVYKSEEEALNANLMNDKLVKYTAGDARFKDLSGPDGTSDGIINQYDKTSIGSSMPDLFGGIQNTFTYNRWKLNTLVNFVSGNEIFNYVRYKNELMTGLENQSLSVLDRWQYDGQITDVPRALWNDPVGNSSFSTRWIEDGSYLRVQNISLSYRIPNKFLQFRNAEFYVSASNVLSVSKYLGYDPEFSYSYSHAEQGVDYGQTPQARQFLIGIKLGL
jgi:TonB-linked SusC/RagA family outer membrane protein